MSDQDIGITEVENQQAPAQIEDASVSASVEVPAEEPEEKPASEAASEAASEPASEPTVSEIDPGVSENGTSDGIKGAADGVVADSQPEISEDSQEVSKSSENGTAAAVQVSAGVAPETGTEPVSESVSAESSHTEEIAAQEGANLKLEEPAETGEDAKETSVQAPATAEVDISADKPALTPLESATKAAEAAKVEVPEGVDVEDSTSLPKQQHKYILSAIKAIKRLKDAGPFLAPVDPVRQGIPQYFEYIKEPMDLSTIEKNLTDGKYVKIAEVIHDFNLMVSNAVVFNGEESQVGKMALGLSPALKKHLTNIPPPEDAESKKRRLTGGSTTTAKASAPAAGPVPEAESPGRDSKHSVKQMRAPGVPMLRRESAADGRPKREIHPSKPRDIPYSVHRPRSKKQTAELKFAGQIVRELMSRKNENITYPFMQPVDPVALGIPNYFDVVKEPMDLSTVQKKLNDNAYYTSDDFEADMRLMFRNCYAFNPAGTPVNELGHKVEALFDKRWLEKPQPAPTPPPMSDSEESDYDDEYDEAGITNPAIKVLEDQLDMMKQQLRKLKREALREWRDRRGKKKARTSMGGSSVRRSSHATGEPRRKSNGASSAPKDDLTQPLHITYEMKKELSESIGTLPEKKLRRVLAIIQESMPQLVSSGQEEIELDMDQVDPKTLRRLYNYVVRQQEDGGDPERAAPSAAPASGLPQKKKKSKPLSEDEQNRQIEEIQNKLRQFQQLEGGKTGGDVEMGGIDATAAAGDDSSSDEDEAPAGPGQFSDDSSSEEE